MLPRLRLDAFFGGDRQQRHVHSVRARHHRVDEPLMPRHIDDADAHAVRQVEVGEAEFDGESTLFFFFKAVRFDAGERLDQLRFAMVDMPGGAEDNMFHDAVFKR